MALLLLTSGINIPAQALSMPDLNPLHLLESSEESSARKAEKAQKEAEAKAEEAQRLADQAQAAADKAQTEASKAKKVAEQTATKTSQPKATQTPRETAAKKPSRWNPINWMFDGSPKDTSPTTKEAAPKPDRPINTLATEATPATPDTLKEGQEKKTLDEAKKMRACLVETQRGTIVFELFPDEAPMTVANFVKLVNEGFYNQNTMKFHRVVPGFVVQTGDPTGTGAGGSKDRIPLEVKNRLSHDTKGVVAMARGPSPNSATSQFYFTLAPQKTLDAKYAIFGRVVSGLDVLDKIEKNDRVYGVKLVDLSTVTRDADPEGKSFLKKWL